MDVAQTNLQLVKELSDAGYSDVHTRLVGDAYNVAARAYVAKFRATGKPLIAHVVGTASLVHRAGCGPVTVAAAILHAAPPDGDFGRRHWKRVVVDEVSAEVADVVEAYDALKWNYSIKQIEDLLSTIDGLAFLEREALILRLANEVEDYLDDAISHYGFPTDPAIEKSAAYRRQYLVDTIPLMVSLAERLGVPYLAELFKDLRTSLPAELPAPPWPRLSKKSTAMFSSPPASYRLRVTAQPAVFARHMRRARSKGARATLAAIGRRLRSS